MKNTLRILKNKNIKLIGLTGGFGTGKSSAAKEFARLGARVIDVDEISRSITKPGYKAYENIVRKFGSDILMKDKSIDRKKLAGIVFKNPKKRRVLEQIVHPEIMTEVNRIIKKLSGSKKSFVILEAPLLFEAGLEKYMYKTIVVFAPVKLQISRIAKRDRLKPSIILVRINAQMDMERKVKLADILIDNSADYAELRSQVKNIWESLTRKK